MKESTAMIKDILKKNYYMDSGDIIDIVNSISMEENLTEYINNIDTSERKRKALGSYFPNTKELSFQPIYIYYTFFQLLRETSYLKDSEDIAKYYNIYNLATIFHELEHVKQVKFSVENKDNTSLNKIVNEGIELGRRCPDNLSLREKMLYKISPLTILTERNAEIMSIYNIVFNDEIASELSKEEYYCLIKKLHDLLTKNYLLYKDNVKCPAEIYYNLRGKSKDFKDIKFDENYNYITKLSWGMPLDYNFVEYISNEAKVKDIKRLIKKID